MAYIIIEDFRGGLDRRRMDVHAPPGSLIELTNAHITRGGEIEKRPAFVEVCDLPSETVGLVSGGGSLYTFGTAAPTSVTFPDNTPNNLIYQQLLHPSNADLVEIVDHEFYNEQIYVIARFADGRTYHYYDGVRILDWFPGQARTKLTITGGSEGGVQSQQGFIFNGTTTDFPANQTTVSINMTSPEGDTLPILSNAIWTGNNEGSINDWLPLINNAQSELTASRGSRTVNGVVQNDILLLTWDEPGGFNNGYSFSITTNSGVAENIWDYFFYDTSVSPAIARTLSFGGLLNSLGDLTVDGISIIDAQVPFVGSNSETALAISDMINDSRSAPEYEAAAFGPNVNIFRTVPGTEANGLLAVATSLGTVTTTFANSGNSPDNSLDGGASFAQVSSYNPGDSVLVYKTKMYSTADSLLHYSALNEVTEWTDPALGAGFINFSNNAKGSDSLVGMASYYANAAIFAEQAIQIWYLDTDDSNNSQVQVINNTGALARHSITEFGENDVFYLSRTGIRSLRARDSSNAAYVGDVGNAVDADIIELIASDETAARNARAVLDQREGRFMLAIGSKIYVFSYFPTSRVQAWSTYEPGFEIKSWAFDGEQLFTRSEDKLYTFGGPTGDIYDDCPVTVQMPFLDSGQPATFKDFFALDMSCENTWTVEMGTNLNDIADRETVATVSNITYGERSAALTGYSTHAALRLTCSREGKAKIGTISLHFNAADQS